jgi:hypothetical protein
MDLFEKREEKNPAATEADRALKEQQIVKSDPYGL